MRAFYVSSALVHVFTKPVSMGCSFPKLSEYIDTGFKGKPASSAPKAGDLVLFFNKKFTYLKVLFYAKDGWCIFAKKLDTGTFDIKENTAILKLAELEKIVNEVHMPTGKKLPRLKKVA